MFEKINKNFGLHNALMLIIGIMGIAYAVYLGLSAHGTSKKGLLVRTETISQFITAKDIALLQGSEADLNNPAYAALKNKLISIKEVNPDIRFVYLNGIKDGEIFFYVDSEIVDSPGYSPPGQPYEEASALMKKMFQEKTDGGFEIASDRWGMWASALIPIVDSETGKTVALLGLDITARKYITDILVYSLSALLFAVLVILLLIGQKRAARHMYLAEESLKATNLEIMNLMKIIDEKEQQIKELEKKISEV